MPLDPAVQALRDEWARTSTPLYTLTVAQARAADLAAIRAGAGNPVPVAEVVDTHIRGPDGRLPIRCYRPATATPPYPTLLYLFGGGWTLGSIETSDGVCRHLANAVPCQVISVGYRLAPEHTFPAAVEDCHAAVRWLADHATDLAVDPARLAVGGDSSGGNLAAAVCLLARDRGGPPIVGQVLVYPNTDYGSQDASMRDNVDPALFNATSVAWYWRHYLATPEDGQNPLASPLRAASLAGLPPALVITAEYDPLRDQAERYGHRLADERVPVTLTRYDGMVHGFFTMTGALDAAHRAHQEAAAHLRSWFAGERRS